MSLVFTKGPEPQGGTPSAAFGSTINTGDVIVAFCGFLVNTATVADTVNTGNYSQLSYYSAGGNGLAIYWKIANATGNPTITLTGGGGYSYMTCGRISGFTGTPTVDSALTATNTATGTTPNINATNNFANECMLVAWEDNSGYGQQMTGYSGWTDATTTSVGQQPGFYAIENSAHTTNNFSGTSSPSEQWWLLLGGIYDLPPSAAIPAAGPMPRRKFILP
jgi:hypothetical protein